MWSRQLKCFAPRFTCVFFDPAGIFPSIWPRRFTRETSDTMTATVIVTSRRRRPCLRAAFEVALCGERRQKKRTTRPVPSRVGALARCKKEARRRTDNFFRLLLPPGEAGSRAFGRFFCSFKKPYFAEVANKQQLPGDLSAEFRGLRTPSG